MGPVSLVTPGFLAEQVIYRVILGSMNNRWQAGERRPERRWRGGGAWSRSGLLGGGGSYL